MPNCTNINDQLEKITQTLNRNILSSIAEQGIVPFNKIKNRYSIVGLGSEETQDNVCVNFVELASCRDEKEQEIAIRTAIWEEYMGVFGISLERPWPLQFLEQKHLIAEQIKLRLHNNLVFVLSPPDKDCHISSPVKSSEKKINVGYEYMRGYAGLASGDGYSQSRGDFLIHASHSNTKYVTEIKTTHEFKMNEVIAILVPTHLIDLANSVFKDKQITILEVPMTCELVGLKKIPQILEILHGHTITEGSYYQVPDYESILKRQILPKHKNFSLHAVRLQTFFDMQLRYVQNITAANMITYMVSSESETIVKYEDNSGWILVHASKIFKLDQKRMQNIRQQLPKYKFPDSDVDVECRDAILKAKGTFAIINYYGYLNEQQQEGLLGLGIKIVSVLSYNVLSVPEQYKDLVKRNLSQAVRLGQQILIEKRLSSVSIIQRVYRGYRVREWLPLYKDTQIAVKAAQQKLKEAIHQFDLAGKQLAIAREQHAIKNQVLSKCRSRIMVPT